VFNLGNFANQWDSVCGFDHPDRRYRIDAYMAFTARSKDRRECFFAVVPRSARWACPAQDGMSASPLKAGIATTTWNVGYKNRSHAASSREI
jgi:hypothetical protein